MKRRFERMLVTDLDGTFIGDDADTLVLWDALDEAGIGLVFATGRHLRAIKDFYKQIPTRRRAHACITMVGTEVWIRRRRRYRRDRGWSQVITVGWDRQTVVDAVEDVEGIRLQDEQWQSDFKISWFVDDPERTVPEVRRRLEERGLEATVVFSGGELLDLLPPRAGKGKATAFLARRFGLGSDDVVTAGDSGNDTDMMRPELGFRSIVVGNAEDELRSLEGEHVYHADAEHAAGIMEGLEQFGWL